MSGSKGLIDKKVTELVSEIYNRVDGRGVLAGSALAEALEIADAALRRAKAEVLRELTQSLTYTRFNSYEQGMCERGCGLTKEGKIGASIGLAWALGEIDARATLQKGRT